MGTFSENLESINEVLQRLEFQDTPLEEALELFEKGVALIRENQKLLDEAEQQVCVLTEQGEFPFEK